MMEGPGADSEEKHEPVSDIDTAVVVVGLKALDSEWPIREAIDPEPTRRAAEPIELVGKFLMERDGAARRSAPDFVYKRTTMKP